MPYASNSELPPAVKKLSKKKQEAFRAAFNSGFKQHGDETTAFKIAWSAVGKVKESDSMKAQFIERAFSSKQRKALAKSGKAMENGSYPIENRGDLENAIRAIGRAPDPAAVKAHIKKRAKALGATDALPDSWSSESCVEVPARLESLLFEADGVTQKSTSFDAIQGRVRDAIYQAMADGKDMDLDGDNDAGNYCCIMDLFADSVVYSMDGELFQAPYTDDGETATVGTPVEVEQSYTEVPNDADVTDDDNAESHRALVGSVVQLEEAAYDASKGELTMTVIKPGFSKNTTEGRQRYYPASTLKRDHQIFEGAKMFADHQTDKEARERPEGSVNNWVATLGKTWTEADGTVKAKADVIDPTFKAKLGALSEKGLLNQMGVSVRIGAKLSKAEIEGQEAMSIDSILSNRSVDFVTYAGAGGAVEMMESDSDSANDLELASEAQLRKVRPDLVQLIEAKFDSKSNGREALMKTLEEKLQEAEKALAAEKKRAETAEANVATLNSTLAANPNQVAVAAANKRADAAETRANANEAQVQILTTRLEEADLAAKKTQAAAELTRLLNASKLPELSYPRITAKFIDAVSSEGMKEAIATELGYIKSVHGSAKVTGMGERHNSLMVSEADQHKRRVEIMKKNGMTQEQAEIAAAGR